MPSQRLTRIMLESIYYSGGASLANKTLRGRGSILMLHRVNDQSKKGFSPNSHLTISPDFLERVLKNFSESIYQFVSLDEAVRRISADDRGGECDRPFIAVTLDDGYRDNLQFAVPLFRKYQVPYTIYVAPGLVDGRASLWWEDLENIIAMRDRLDIDMPGGREEFTIATQEGKSKTFDHLLNHLAFQVSESEQRRVIKDLSWLYSWDCEKHRADSIMNWEELRTLANDPLCSLGAHTIGHFAVGRLAESDARYEMQESKRLVELECGRAVKHFAYPYGYPAAAAQRDFKLAAECGFDSAVTTRHGVCYPQHKDHLTALPRISVNGNFQKMRYVRTLISGATTRIANKGKLLNIA